MVTFDVAPSRPLKSEGRSQGHAPNRRLSGIFNGKNGFVGT